MKKHAVLAAMLSLPVLFPGCAAPGPVVPVPPTVDVTRFESVLITPDMIRFEGKVVIANQMNGPLSIQKVDFGADLHDNPIFTDTFAKLHPMKSGATQTVTLPFQIAMADLVNQVEDVLAEEEVRVALNGTVFPEGFDPIDFHATKVIPIPEMPEVAIDDMRGNPLDGEFTVFLRVKNTNDFPLTLEAVDSFLNLNGKKHPLLRTESFSHMGPGDSGRVALTMRKTKGKGLSMLVNVAKNRNADFTVGGMISCSTPHGIIRLPLELSSSSN